MNNNRCVCCGEIIQEGRRVCLCCEYQKIQMGKILQSNRATKEDVIQAYNFMEGNDDT